MNTPIQLTLKLLLISLLLAACGARTINGSGKIVSESRTVSGIDAITLAGRGDLTVIQGEAESLTVQADDNLLPYIKTEVQGGRLTIGFDRDDWPVFYHPSQSIQFILTVKDITALELAGFGNIDVPSLHAERLALTISGSGQITVGHLDATELTCTLDGSGDADIAGQVTGQQITIRGSGDYQAGDLQSQTAQIMVRGRGNAILWAEDSLNVNISGSGSVNYYGRPEITTDNSGSGDVASLGDK